MPSKEFVLIAHRGFSSKAPENTLASFRLALQGGFPQIELDVQLTKDNAPIVFHDDGLERTTNGKGKIRDLTLGNIKRLDAGSWFDDAFAGEQVPALQEVLIKIGKVAHLHIELKSREAELPELVAKQVSDAGLIYPDHNAFSVPGITITSFLIEQLERSIKLLPNIVHSWLVNMINDEQIAKAQQAGIAQLCPKASEVSSSGVDSAISEGLSVRGWGVKGEEDVIRLYKAGTQGTTVNWPDQAKQILNSYQAV